MLLPLQSFATLVQNQAATVQAKCKSLLDLTVGSVLRAILEANAGVVMHQQLTALMVLSTARAATSNGTDLDSFVQQFGLTRPAAVAATGAVTFSRASTGASAFIQPGATVITADGSTTFEVATDTTNAAWNAAMGGYFIPATTLSVTVPVAALVAGVAGNIQAGAISLFGSSVNGVNVVTNALAFTNGVDAMSDPALRILFQNYMQTRAQGTPAAVFFAVSTVASNLTCNIAENQLPDGTYQPGNFVVTVDDGTGNPSSTTLANVTVAVNAVRPIGSTFQVQGPSELLANVGATITVSAGYTLGTVQGLVSTALTAFIDALPVGAPLPYGRLYQVIWDASPGIATVGSPLLNGGTSDIGGGTTQAVRAGTMAVS